MHFLFPPLREHRYFARASLSHVCGCLLAVTQQRSACGRVGEVVYGSSCKLQRVADGLGQLWLVRVEPGGGGLCKQAESAQAPPLCKLYLGWRVQVSSVALRANFLHPYPATKLFPENPNFWTDTEMRHSYLDPVSNCTSFIPRVFEH
jgi:hypothetical protein